MKKYTWFVLISLLAITLPLSACSGGDEQPAPPAQEETAEEPTEAEPNAEPAEEEAPKSDVTLKVFFGSVGDEVGSYGELIEQFTADTGIAVEVVQAPQSATDNLAQQLQFLGAGSGDIDVYQIDVIWPGILAQHALDLYEYIPRSEVDAHFPAIVENNTVDGSLVALPWYTDAGILYYRTDLLEKYGYSDPPTTWDELEEMAAAIQDGERSAGNDAFWGYVWQGNNYEGLTCDALEWQYSHDGGRIIEPDGTITVNNANVATALNRAAGWVDTISPPGVTTYQEEDARGVWQSGNAAFMRNWPYAYALGNSDDSPIKEMFDATVLPTGATNHAGTLGGWQLMVAKYSEHPEEAVELVRFIAGRDAQKSRAITNSYLPTIGSLYKDTDLLEAQPFMGVMFDVFNSAVARPSTITGDLYNQVSAAYFNAVHSVLTGEEVAEDALLDLEDDLVDITGLTPGTLEGVAEADTGGTLTSATASNDFLTRDYEGASIKVFFGSVGDEVGSYGQLIEEFTEATGIEVEVVQAPQSATDNLAQQLQFLGAGSGDLDVYQIDVIWPGILAQHAVDLTEHIPSEEIESHFPAIVENNTVDGSLVALPWYTDAGILYYRTDLLEKYGYDSPPDSWDELEEMAATIQEGERGEGNDSFWGYVWQGNNYEGLTCDALEWQYSHDGGRIIEPDGTITVNNPAAAAAFTRAAGWVDTISPPGVTTYQEEDARGVWQSGNAAFMRNWPYAYALGNSDDSPINGLFDATVLPTGGTSKAGTLGGWQLMVSKYSANVEASAMLVRYLAGREGQKTRAITNSYLPTIAGLYSDPELLDAQPFMGPLYDVFVNAVARPSTVTGELYNQVSAAYFNAVHSVLTGEAVAEDALLDLEDDLVDITGFTPGAVPAVAAPAEEAEESMAEEEAMEETASADFLTRDYEGATVKVFFGSVGDEVGSYGELIEQFTEATGIEVEVVQAPQSATDNLAQQLQFLGAGSGDLDVYQIDVIWPGILAQHAVDLAEYIPSEEIESHFPAIVENNTVDGKLVGFPWYTDAGILYYRTDLLEKYGYDSPPDSWDELEEMAATIQEGERGEGNDSFWGYVWQGNNYEGLTCDALEWQYSHDGGRIIEPDGTITVNNPAAAAAFTRAAGWVDTISPPGVTTYQEEDARGVWQSGNAAFMRNWPYAYALGNSDDSPINGLFDATVLPTGGTSKAGTLGGWQLMVSKYSANVEASAMLVRYLAGREGQKTRAITNSYLPTIAGLYSDPELLEAQPFMGPLYDVFVNAVARPSTVTGELYNQVSAAYFNAVHSILTGEEVAEDALLDLEDDLIDITGFEPGQ